MQTKDITKVIYCLTCCENKDACEVFSTCIGSKNCLIPTLNECDQLSRCRRIKKVVRAILKCEKLAEIYNIEGGDN